jgi:hypothetical protein
VRNPLLSRGAMIFSAACLICLCITLPSREQGLRHQRVALLTDWTTHHVLYPLYGSADRMESAKRDPRATFSWWRLNPSRPRPILPRPVRNTRNSFDRDWSINLGVGGVAPNAFPAKYTFDITAAPSCANDYVVYPLNTGGSATQANIVAFNNLYSGTAGGTGVCNRTPGGADDGVDATVMWSYNVNAIGGAVPTSPVISWDNTTGAASVLGTKIAFIESVSGGGDAHFHVLAFKAGDGVDATNLQNTMKPVSITTFVGNPANGSGTASDLALSADAGGPSTISPPFIDYTHDYAYVGNDAGDLYRIKDVFCPSFNTDAGCTSGAGPSLDMTWGSGHGYVAVGGGCGQLSGAVEDFATGRVFIGCSDGRVYAFTSTGAKTTSPTNFLGLGEGVSNSPNGGIVVPPIVDSSNGFVYAVAGTNDASPVLLQASTTTFTSTTLRIVPLGLAPTSTPQNLSLPAFNTSYFSSATSSTWAVLSCGFDSTGTLTDVYDVGFSGTRVMNTTTPTGSAVFQLAPDVEPCSPLTGFTNLNVGPPFPPTDWLFLGLSGGSVFNFNLNGTTGSAFGTLFVTPTDTYTISGGPSGIIVDNESTDPQASSIYFGSLGTQACTTGGTGYCAVKLTQAGLE